VDLRATLVPVPPAAEVEALHRRVQSLLDAADTVCGKMSDGVARVDDLDRTILAKAFRGELVPQDPNDEPASVLLERIRSERERDGARVGRGKRPARHAAS
jgi:type I restriction enzyme S subunit